MCPNDDTDGWSHKRLFLTFLIYVGMREPFSNKMVMMTMTTMMMITRRRRKRRRKITTRITTTTRTVFLFYTWCISSVRKISSQKESQYVFTYICIYVVRMHFPFSPTRVRMHAPTTRWGLFLMRTQICDDYNKER